MANIKLKSLVETKKIQNEVVTSHNAFLSIDDKLLDILSDIDECLDRVVGGKSYEKTSIYKKYEKANRDFFVNSLDMKYVPNINNSLDEMVNYYSEELKKRTEKLTSDLKAEVSKIKNKLK